MSEVFDEYFVILNSMLHEYIESYEVKEFAFCNKSFIHAKMFQAFYSKDVKSYIKFDEKLNNFYLKENIFFFHV